MKTLGDETQQNVSKYLTYGTLSSNTGKTFYCRGFYPSSYLLSGIQSRNGSNNSYTLDFSLAHYAEKIISSSYGSSYSCSYGAETTAMMYLSLGWFYSQSESVSIRHESEFKLKSDTNFTAYSNYFKVNFSGSDNGTIKVTAVPGFLITKISYAYFKTENWWEDTFWGGDWHTDRSWAPYTTEYTLTNQNDGDHNSIVGIKNFVVSVMPISYYIKIHKISQGTKAQTATAVSGETDEIEIRNVVHGGAVVDAQYADWNPFFVVNSQINDNQQFGEYSAFYQTMVNGLSSGTKILTPETLYSSVWNESLVGNYNMELGDFVSHANKDYINFVAFEARFVADPNGGSDYKPVNIKTKPREGGMERAAILPPLLEDETFAVYEGDNGYDYISSVVTYNNANISTWAIDENEYLPGTQTENPNFGKWTWNSLKPYSTLDDETDVFIQYRPVAIGHTAGQIIFKNDFVRNDGTTDLVDSAKDYFESLSGPGGGVINLYLPMTPKTYTFNILYRDGFVDKVGDNNSPLDETEVKNLQAESVKIKLDGAALAAIESFRAFALENEEQCEVFEYPEASGNFFFRYKTNAVSGINVLKKGISFVPAVSTIHFLKTTNQ